MPRLLRFALRSVFVVALLLALAVLAAWAALRGSLAPLAGQLALAGLSAPVSVERDGNGTVTIRAGSEADAMRALGLVHAQERYFEMDLLRRSSAGELSALFGPIAVERDKQARVHRLRARVLRDPAAFLGDKDAVARAYQQGVNAGLASLAVRPWPYLLLRQAPQPWRLEDTALAGYAMFFDLQDATNARELALWRVRPHLPAPLYRLITADGSEWDAPLMGEARGNPALPGPEELDLRALSAPDARVAAVDHDAPAAGSNNWAVAGALTADGRAILANDMHLGHRAPNIWFRVRLLYPDARAPGGQVDVSGVSLPGVPGVIVGSNGHVAWGFTNSYGDFADWAEPNGAVVTEIEETIEVAGGEAVRFVVEETADGPLIAAAADGEKLQLRWTAQRPGALNLRLLDMAFAGGLDEVRRLADELGIPGQNLLAADRSGRIGWLLAGRIPVRADGPGECDPQLPADAQNRCRFDAWLAAAQRPQLIDPPAHRLWTANARVADGEALRLLGDAGYALGARGKQIRDALFAADRFDENALLALQLDDRALFLERWHRLLGERAAAQDDPALRALADAARRWEGRADSDAVSYRLVRTWRQQVLDRIGKGLLAPAQAALGAEAKLPSIPQLEGIAWPLVTQRPANLLPAAFDSWEALFADAAAQAVTQLEAAGPLAARRWGEQNAARICHPLAAALPGLLRARLCMPGDPLAGDNHMPRVQGPSFGASERMVVAPGHEQDGYLHMPGGQSGHPLSPYWGAGHADWVKGERTPFLPGATVHTLSLRPN